MNDRWLYARIQQRKVVGGQHSGMSRRASWYYVRDAIFIGSARFHASSACLYTSPLHHDPHDSSSPIQPIHPIHPRAPR